MFAIILNMNTEQEKFVQKNSPDGGFLQSDQWSMFQEKTGKSKIAILSDCFCVNAFTHILNIVGLYVYAPRGPVFDLENKACAEEGFLKLFFHSKKIGAGWIRVDVLNREQFEFIETLGVSVKKAPHNVQPRQIFVIDIDGGEDEIMANMKPKTRYNIRLARKKGVEIERHKKNDADFDKYFEEFLRLTDVMSKRNKIVSHSKDYYQKMVENIPSENLSLYVSKYKEKIIASALVVFYGEMATYLHGASDDEYRNIMAPFLLQWEAIEDAKEKGCKKYDFGGVDVREVDGKLEVNKSSLAGISRFKLGFSKNTKPIKYLGSYDLILSFWRYNLYLILQKAKKTLKFR